MRRLTAVLLAVLFATPALAQDPWVYPGILAKIAGGEPIVGSQTADDTGVAILVRYIGAQGGTGATVQVAADDLVFTTDGSTADSDVAAASGDCGATPGTLDTGNAACDTIGELCDQINESASWRCVILDALRTDASAFLLTAAATPAAKLDGVQIKWETAAKFQTIQALVPNEYRSMRPYFNAGTNTLKPNPFAGSRTILSKCNATSTYGSGTSFFEVYGSVLGQTTGGTAGTETTRTAWREAGGATTVAKAFDFQPGMLWSVLPGTGGLGERLVAKINNSAAQSVVNLTCNGTMYK